MPAYEYKCAKCGDTYSLIQSMKEDTPETIFCAPNQCKGIMYRVYGFSTPHDSYSKPLVSDALAMHPSQIAEHRRMFPNIKVHEDGRPEFTSFSQHDDYLKATGFHKKRQKIRPGTRKIYKKTIQTD